MDDVEDFDELSLNLSTLSNNSNDNMEITSDIDNRVGSLVKFPPTFGSKEELDFFLQLKIAEFSKKDIISTYDKRIQDYYEAAINGKGANYIINYILTKEANSYSRQSDSNTLFLLLYSKLTSTTREEGHGHHIEYAFFAWLCKYFENCRVHSFLFCFLL